MSRGRPRPVVPAAPWAAAADRLRRPFAADPAAARARAAADPSTLAALLAQAILDAAAAGDVASLGPLLEEAATVEGACGDARAALHLAAAEGAAASDPHAPAAEDHLVFAAGAAEHPALLGTALGRLALLYRARSIPLGFRHYAARALRFLDATGGTGMHPGADRDAARLCRAVLEYHHRRDEPERSGRAPVVLDRVRDADPESTVHGLKYHGLALGRLREWEAARRAFAESARIAEAEGLRGCDGVFVYAAAVLAQEKDFPGARRLLTRVHIRRLEPEEKALFRQFRHLVETAEEHRPLTGTKAQAFLRAQRRREEKLEEDRRAAAVRREPAPVAGAPGTSGSVGTPRKGGKAKAAAGPRPKARSEKKASKAKRRKGTKTTKAARKR